MRDAFRFVVLGLWMVNTVLAVTVTLTYLDQRRRRWLHQVAPRYVLLLGLSYVLSTGLDAYQIAERIGRHHFDAWSPISMVAMACGDWALLWILVFQMRLGRRERAERSDDG